MKIIFDAEVVEVKTRKTVSVDREITIKLVTNQIDALQLQEVIAESAVTIEVEIKE